MSVKDDATEFMKAGKRFVKAYGEGITEAFKPLSQAAKERSDETAPTRTCHNRAHPDRIAVAVIMGYWWCQECYDEANELT